MVYFEILYFTDCPPWVGVDRNPNGKTNRDCQLQIGREMLREPLLNSDEYVPKNDHNGHKGTNNIQKMLTFDAEK